eukprot:6465465-Amphidinium_carterae.1
MPLQPGTPLDSDVFPFEAVSMRRQSALRAGKAGEDMEVDSDSDRLVLSPNVTQQTTSSRLNPSSPRQYNMVESVALVAGMLRASASSEQDARNEIQTYRNHQHGFRWCRTSPSKVLSVLSKAYVPIPSQDQQFLQWTLHELESYRYADGTQFCVLLHLDSTSGEQMPRQIILSMKSYITRKTCP